MEMASLIGKKTKTLKRKAYQTTGNTIANINPLTIDDLQNKILFIMNSEFTVHSLSFVVFPPPFLFSSFTFFNLLSHLLPVLLSHFICSASFIPLVTHSLISSFTDPFVRHHFFVAIIPSLLRATPFLCNSIFMHSKSDDLDFVFLDLDFCCI